jgi:hypothetical protein
MITITPNSLQDTTFDVTNMPLTLDAILSLSLLSHESVELGNDQEEVLSIMLRAAIHPRSEEAWLACAALAPDIATCLWA